MKLYCFAIVLAVNFVAPILCAPDKFLVNDKSAEIGDATTVHPEVGPGPNTPSPNTTVTPITVTIPVFPTTVNPTTTPATTTSTASPTTIKPTASTTKAPTSTTSVGPKTTVPTNVTTEAPAPATTTPTPGSRSREFDGPSFLGGIILACGLSAIGFVGFKFYKARTERNYHTFYDSEL